MRFEWNEAKDEANQAKHGVSFTEAIELFSSPIDYLEIFDAEHSIDEDRFIRIGLLANGVVVLVYTEPEEDLTRIISARRATPGEEERLSIYMKEHGYE